jgi:ABC-type lipoprotein release transport system permease subunit
MGRNPRRSIITAVALAVGYFSVVIIVGLTLGFVAQMIENGTGMITGQIQIHDSEYRPDRSVYATIGGSEGTDVAALVTAVTDDPAVEAAAPRVYGSGLVSVGPSTSAALFMGVDSDAERHVSRILGSIVRGRAPRTSTNEILIGAGMARDLGAEPDTQVVIVAPAIDGSMGNDLFTVSGVFRSSLADVDRTYAFMPIGALQSLMAMPDDRVHEIAAAVANPWEADQAAERLASDSAVESLEIAVEPWTKLRPDMVEYAQLAKASQWILLFVVFIMAVFGVANTLLMATFERRYEFAVLLSLGTPPTGIWRSVIYEALALGVVGLVAGVAITLPIMLWWHTAPPDVSWLFGGFQMLGALMRPVLRVEYPWTMVFVAALSLFLTAVLAALYPAIRAARVPPADTLAGR